MERVVVGRVNSHHRYLFALSPQDLSEFPQGNLNLFFLRKRTLLDVRTCGGLLCFNSYDGRVVLCNPTTRQLKFLPPIPIPRPRPRSRGPVKLLFKVCGFGYDSTSDDYKVIRAYDVIYHDSDIFRAKTIGKIQLYSLRRNSWSEIPFPRIKYDFVLPPMSGTAFVKGSVYLVAYYDYTKKVLAFDFATETFSYFSLPPPLDEDTCFHAVNIDDDSLGVVLYTRDEVSKSFEVWVWREENKSWSRLYDRFVVDDVERPVGLKDGRLLFLERERSPNINDPPRNCPPHTRKQLVVYDLVEKRLKEFDIYDYHFGSITVNSYVESRVELPNSMPIGYYDDEASWNQYWNRWEAEVNNVNNRFRRPRRYGGGERRQSEREGRRCVRRERGRERERVR